MYFIMVVGKVPLARHIGHLDKPLHKSMFIFLLQGDTDSVLTRFIVYTTY